MRECEFESHPSHMESNIVSMPADGRDRPIEGEFREYLFSYHFQGAEWQVSVPATSETEARERLSRAAAGNWDGILEAKLPLAFGPFVEIGCAVANWWQSIKNR